MRDETYVSDLDILSDQVCGFPLHHVGYTSEYLYNKHQ